MGVLAGCGSGSLGCRCGRVKREMVVWIFLAELLRFQSRSGPAERSCQGVVANEM